MKWNLTYASKLWWKFNILVFLIFKQNTQDYLVSLVSKFWWNLCDLVSLARDGLEKIFISAPSRPHTLPFFRGVNLLNIF